jgi:hypothetical protein
VTLTLQWPLPAFAGGASVDKPVTADVRLRDDLRCVDVTWTPVASGLFPQFEGAFTTERAGAEACTLTLGGVYDAPGGMAGAAFDAVIGYRIAQTTIEQLVRELALAAAADYRVRAAL